MTQLKTYTQFESAHWETGTVGNFWAYRGVKAPHTSKPYSEAMLMGISGGMVMGYFSFAYEGYDPHVVILTRNTFDPLDTLLTRLGVVQELQHTSKPEKAWSNLVDTLENGMPAIVWADTYSLPYNSLPYDAGMWGMSPIVVYGVDENEDTAWIADRAGAPLTVSLDELAAARSRVKKVKFRILTLSEPNEDKVKAAVQKGIWDSIKLYTEKPPKGAANNFGFLAYKRWAEVLTKPKARLSWAKEFPIGGKLYSGLLSTFTSAFVYGKQASLLDAERLMYAQFLNEASEVLDRPGLQDAAEKVKDSAKSWKLLASLLLPDEVPAFKETRELELKKDKVFREQGNAGLPEIIKINTRLAEIKAEVTSDFPLDESGVTALCAEIAEGVMAIHDVEREAVEMMQAAMV